MISFLRPYTCSRWAGKYIRRGVRVGGVHLGHGGHEGAVDAPVALNHVLREETAGAQFGDAQRRRSHAGGGAVLVVSVSAVGPAAARLVGLGIHDLLGESAKQLLHIDGAVVEPGHGEYVRHRV